MLDYDFSKLSLMTDEEINKELISLCPNTELWKNKAAEQFGFDPKLFESIMHHKADILGDVTLSTPLIEDAFIRINKLYNSDIYSTVYDMLKSISKSAIHDENALYIRTFSTPFGLYKFIEAKANWNTLCARIRNQKPCNRPSLLFTLRCELCQ